MASGSDDQPIDYPIDGTLDLHQFRANETRDAVLAYLEACSEQGITSVRIVHGKGIGVQREIVRTLLAAHPDVEQFWSESAAGGWGATVVNLRKALR